MSVQRFSTSSWEIESDTENSNLERGNEMRELIPYVELSRAVDRPFVRPPNFQYQFVKPTYRSQSLEREMPTSSTHSADSNDECRISLKLASEILSTFDGKSMPVKKFAKDCRDVWKSVKPTERGFLIKIIEKKIVGDAKSYLRRRRDNYDVEELLADLEQVFAPRDTLDSLQTSLSIIYQKKGESAIQYGIRVNELLDDILDAVDRECTAETAYGIKIRARDNARNCYITGLSSKIETQVRQKNPEDLRKAIDLAITEEEYCKHRSRIMTREDERVHSSRSGNSSAQEKCQTARVFQAGYSAARNVVPLSFLCFGCKKPGHIRRDCPENKSQAGQFRSNYGKRSREWGPDPDAKRSREHRYSRSNYSQPQNLAAQQPLNSNNTPRNNATGGAIIKARAESTELPMISMQKE